MPRRALAAMRPCSDGAASSTHSRRKWLAPKDPLPVVHTAARGSTSPARFREAARKHPYISIRSGRCRSFRWLSARQFGQLIRPVHRPASPRPGLDQGAGSGRRAGRATRRSSRVRPALAVAGGAWRVVVRGRSGPDRRDPAGRRRTGGSAAVVGAASGGGGPRESPPDTSPDPGGRENPGRTPPPEPIRVRIRSSGGLVPWAWVRDAEVEDDDHDEVAGIPGRSAGLHRADRWTTRRSKPSAASSRTGPTSSRARRIPGRSEGSRRTTRSTRLSVPSGLRLIYSRVGDEIVVMDLMHKANLARAEEPCRDRTARDDEGSPPDSGGEGEVASAGSERIMGQLKTFALSKQQARRELRAFKALLDGRGKGDLGEASDLLPFFCA